MPKALLILSGGMDSCTLAHMYKAEGHDLECISFNYGQKQIIELEHAQKIAKKLNVKHQIVDVSFLKNIFKNSALTDDSIPVPHGAYTKENMSVTMVPNRNTILLSIAWSIACVEKADILAYGAQCGDHYLYPDTRPDYFSAINLALRLGTEDCRNPNLELQAPLLKLSKAEVIKLGLKYNVDYSKTYSCYEGGELHCGKCGACQNRIKAYQELGLKDPIIYN